MSSHKYKLAISIATKNRKECIEEVIKKLGKALCAKNIGLYIFDGSDTRDLEMIVKNFVDQGLDNIHYYYYDPQEYECEEKRYQRGYDSRCLVDARYIWFCSDRLVPRKENLDAVLERVNEGYDVIIYNALYCRGEVTKEYSCQTDFFRECGAKVQMLLCPILEKSIAQDCSIDRFRKTNEMEKYGEVEFIFRSIASKDHFSGLLLCFGERTRLPIQPDQVVLSGHVKEARTLEWFIKRMYNAVSDLPAIYDSEKEIVMKNFNKDTWFSLEGFAMLRAQGGYHFKQCFKYMDKWHLVTDVPVIVILAIALLPSELAKRMFRRICQYKKLKGQQHFKKG